MVTILAISHPNMILYHEMPTGGNANHPGIRLMPDKKKSIDRRKHRRYQVQDGAFAALISGSNAKLGLINDICEEGLAFRYVVDDSDQENECVHNSCTLDILFDAEGYFLESIPCTTIWERPLQSEDSFSHLVLKKCSVHFGPLTSEQRAKLIYFINNFAQQTQVTTA
jgi:hypothetical protein